MKSKGNWNYLELSEFYFVANCATSLLPYETQRKWRNYTCKQQTHSFVSNKYVSQVLYQML